MANGYNPKIAPTVLGSGTQPLQFLQSNRALNQRKEQQQAVISQRQQASRDKQIAAQFEFNPGKTFAPYTNEIMDMVGGHGKWIQHHLEIGTDLNSAKYLQEKRQHEDVINEAAGAGAYLGKVYEKEQALINNDPNLLQKETHNELNNMLFSDDGQTGNPMATMDINEMTAVRHNPKNFDINAIGERFVGTLGEKLSKVYGELGDEGDRHFSITDIKQSALLRRNPKGHWEIAITPEVIEMANLDPYLGSYLTMYKEQEGIEDDKEALTQILKRYIPPADVKKSPGRAIGGGSGSGAGDKQKLREGKVQTRLDILEAALYKNDPTALAAASNFLDGIDITFARDVQFGPQGTLEGEIKGISVKTDPGRYDKWGEPLKEKEIVIPFGNPAQNERAFWQLHNFLEEQSATKDAISVEELKQLMEKLNKSQGGGAIYKAEENGKPKYNWK